MWRLPVLLMGSNGGGGRWKAPQPLQAVHTDAPPPPPPSANGCTAHIRQHGLTWGASGLAPWVRGSVGLEVCGPWAKGWVRRAWQCVNLVAACCCGSKVMTLAARGSPIANLGGTPIATCW